MGRTPSASARESMLPIMVDPSHHRYHRHYHDNMPPPPPPTTFQPRFRKWFPWMVPTIIIANIVIFIASMRVNNCPAHYNDCVAVKELGAFAFQSMHENPLLGPSSSTLLKMGAMDVKKVVEEHQVWRLVSCMWLHAGVVHIFANMLSLLFVGIRLEQEFGFVRIILLYVISGISGSLASSLFVRNNISVGASGALFGFLGGMLSELFVNWTIYEDKIESLLCLLIIILINMAVGILPHIDNFAHLGGFFTGFLLGFILLIRPQFGWVKVKNAPPGYPMPKSKPKYKTYQCLLLIVSTIILAIGLTVGLIMLLQGVDGNNYCSWCHYLSCVPTPMWSCDAAQCMSTQMDNQVNLTCLQNHKTQTYKLLDNGVNNTVKIQQLCADLCS